MVKSLGFILEVLESWWRHIGSVNLSGDIKDPSAMMWRTGCKGASEMPERLAETLCNHQDLTEFKALSLPVAAVTNYLSGLKQAKFTLLLFWRLKVQKQFH